MRPPRTILWIYEIVHIKDPADTWDIVAAPETGATSLGDFAWLTLQAHSIWGSRSAVRLSCRVGGDSPVPLLIRDTERSISLCLLRILRRVTGVYVAS